MSEIIIYRSKIEQATDTALFDLMSAEWMFPLIVAVSVAVLFFVMTEQWFMKKANQEKYEKKLVAGKHRHMQNHRVRAAKIQQKWEWIQYGTAGFIGGVVFYTMMSKIS